MRTTKAMILSVGTGLANSEQAVADLAQALIGSINAANPDKVFLVVSPQSQAKTLPLLEPNLSMDWEAILIENEDDIEATYSCLYPRFRQIRNDYDLITVDYTSGTKAMTGALVLLGTIFDAYNLTYVGGRRVNGRVVKGTEKLNVVKPIFASVERRIERAVSFFNSCQYDAAIFIIDEIRRLTSDPQITDRLEPLEKASRAYSLWEDFQHEPAFAALKEVRIDAFDANRRFLGKMQSSDEKEPFLIADIINNARRRGSISFRYEDAVGRLYRVIELIAQYRLKSYGIADTGSVDPKLIDGELRKKWREYGSAPLKLGLRKSYELLAVKDDELGKEYEGDNRLRDLLKKRNNAILAHGLDPVAKDVYEGLLDKALTYASMVVPKLNQLCQDAEFINWHE